MQVRACTAMHSDRKGAVMVLGVVALVATLCFVGFAVDLGMINVTKSRMQGTADAVALAAVKEIQVAIQTIGTEGGDASSVDAVTAFAVERAGDVAARIAELNGLHLDPSTDLKFGRRVMHEDGSFGIVWDSGPYNVIKATLRKDNPDPSAPDAKLPLAFAPVYGDRTATITASATAYIEPRDIVAVLDYSGSMSYDTMLASNAVNHFGLSAVETGLDDVWNALATSNAVFSDEQSTKKFPASGFGKLNTYAGGYISSNNAETVFNELELGGEEGDGVTFYDWPNYQPGDFQRTLPSGVYNTSYLESYGMNQDISSFKAPSGYTVTFWDYESGGGAGGWVWGPLTGNRSSLGSYDQDISYIIIEYEGSNYVPFPQEGRHNDGTLKGKPSKVDSKAMWLDYINWVRTNNNFGYKKKYNYRTLMAYLMAKKARNDQSEDLWRAPIYPFHAMKEGMSMFTEFLEALSFGDRLGLSVYATTARRETKLEYDSAFVEVDLGEEHLTNNFAAINTIQRHKQASHYDNTTNIGDGIKEARYLLDEQGRGAVRKTLIVMTDGNANERPSGFALPGDWNWSKLTDYDGDGSPDYSTSNKDKQYAFAQAKLAIDQGYTIHTMAVGAGADKELMRAIAFAGNGRFIDVPGGTSVAEMREQLETAFILLAGNVPQGKLTTDD